MKSQSSLICFCLRTPSQLSGIRWFLGNQPGTTGEARNWCNRNQNEILKFYRNPSRNLTSDNFEYYQDYHCDLFIVANLGETLIFFQHTSGVRVTHGFGGSIGATSILPRSSSWRWVLVHCDEKTHFVWKIHSPQVYSWVWFQASVFHGWFSRKTSFVFRGEAASLLSIFTVVWFCALRSLCSVLTYTKLHPRDGESAKIDSAPGFSKRCVFFWRSNFRLALSVNGSFGSCASLSSRICQEMPAKMITAFPDMLPSIEIGIVNLTWSSVHFISYQEKHLQSSKKQKQKYS